MSIALMLSAHLFLTHTSISIMSEGAKQSFADSVLQEPCFATRVMDERMNKRLSSM